MGLIYRFLGLLCLLLCSHNLKSQDLAQTRWKTTFNNTNIIVEFTVDSLNLIIGNEQLDISTYSTSQDTLLLTDHPDSACSDTILGIYVFSVINDTMFVDLVSDSCENRMLFFANSKLVKCITSSVFFNDTDKPVIFPNPNTTSIFFIKNRERVKFEFEIYTLSGRLIQKGKTIEEIDVIENDATLFLKLENMGKNYTYKLIQN